MKTLRPGNEMIYNDPGNLYEAFRDILHATRSNIFTNITFNKEEGILKYDVFGEKQIKVIFNMDQPTPEVVTDMLQWFFSMLDGAVNL